MIMIQILDVSSAECVVFSFRTGLFVRLVRRVIIHFDLILSQTSWRSFLIKTLPESLSVLKGRSSTNSKSTRWDWLQWVPKWRNFLQVDNVNGDVAKVVRDANLKKKFTEINTLLQKKEIYYVCIIYQLARSNGHVLDTAPWKRNTIQNTTRLPSVNPETVLCRTEQTLAFRMEINRSIKENNKRCMKFPVCCKLNRKLKNKKKTWCRLFPDPNWIPK